MGQESFDTKLVDRLCERHVAELKDLKQDFYKLLITFVTMLGSAATYAMIYTDHERFVFGLMIAGLAAGLSHLTQPAEHLQHDVVVPAGAFQLGRQ